MRLWLVPGTTGLILLNGNSMNYCREITRKWLMLFCTGSLGLILTTCSSNVHKVSEAWKALPVAKETGLLEEHLELWRDTRLWSVADSGYLLSGFEDRPGVHPWQGEHVGKWLHAAILAYMAKPEEDLKKKIDETVHRLIATQLPNGYMGTYAEKERFYIVPEDTRGWDVWTHRYNLYGLLIYQKYFPDAQVLNACRKMGDLLIDTFGEEKSDITGYGTRQGISSTTILESMVMLYEATGDDRYLDFAKLVVERSEAKPGLKLMGAMLNHESVSGPGEGKAYQLMSNLLGYYRLYLCTGQKEYLQTVLNGWQEIRNSHLLVTGGPWTRKMSYNANKECFAREGDFDPVLATVENCCTVTWIQLNLNLFELTGKAGFAREAEKAVYNHLFCSQDLDGVDWCYYTPPNEYERAFEPAITCCASSGPRALEMFSSHLAGTIDGHLSVGSLASSVIPLPERFGGGELKVSGKFPYDPTTEFIFNTDKAKEFTFEFRIPSGSLLGSLELNGEPITPRENARGFYEIRNKWKQEDRLTVHLEYQLEVTFQKGSDNKTWIAFTYGPLALAQVISSGMDLEEPFRDVHVEDNSPQEITGLLSRDEDATGRPLFRIKDTDITLIPYHLVGSLSSGPRTYFECSL